MTKELSSLNSKKERTIGNIPTKVVKTYPLIFVIKYFKIWNSEISGKQYFPQNLKLADITLAYVSALATASKVFGGIIQKRLSTHIERGFFSTFLSGYRKGFSTKFALISLTEKWRKCLNSKEYTVAVLLNLSKAFDVINHELLIAKFHTYGSKVSLKISLNYLSDH